MTIEISMSPDNAIDVFVDGLIDFNAFDDVALGTITLPLATGATPLPVVFAADRSAVPATIRDIPHSWRFVFDLDGKPMMAHLTTDGCPVRFLSLTEGWGAEALLQAIAVSGEFAEARNEVYSMRIVEVPSAGDMAILLSGREHEWMIGVLRGGMVISPDPLPVSDYLSNIR